MPSILVHGGAGRDTDPEDRDERRAGLRCAANAGWRVLERGGHALDAVVAATVELEDDPRFNAGRGSVLTEAGTVEMDASLMDGRTLAAGAVAAVTRLAHPIRGARAVLDGGREVLMVGDHACDLAARAGVRLVDPRTLVTEEARRRWLARRAGAGDTVGAVARDVAGHLAAATSTGGTTDKRPGRVGDSAVIGAGTYADDRLGAVSCTGAGEMIIRLSLARVALAHLGRVGDARRACLLALDELRERLAATAGLILVTPGGALGFACTTETMLVAWRTDDTPAACDADAAGGEAHGTGGS
ncbi:MAG TPA: isoaspartyl peptidase/L-asparaginase family protein [Candidatus Limnocylindria bacterium]|nr:isoaspartyl peptidase/L-asparaginase family protein [Candidatus Limnocylindria bacterium]